MHQTTVDAYLEDIVSSAVDRTANAQARQEVQQMAEVINDAAYDAEQRWSLLVIVMLIINAATLCKVICVCSTVIVGYKCLMFVRLLQCH